MTALRIAITQRRLPATADGIERDALDADWWPWVGEVWPDASLYPMPNLSRQSDAQAWLAALRPHLLILSGGNDVGSSAARDQSERHALDWAAMRSLPVLGVCRGMQMLQVYSGGQLEAVHGHVGRPHHVRTNGQELLVNSWHHWGIAHCVPPWMALAQAEDCTIEAMRHSRLPWLGLMWHPERADGDSPWLRCQLSELDLPTPEHSVPSTL